jgi:hypothetical protein
MSIKNMKDPSALAAKYSARASNAATDYANGVASTSGQAAAAAGAADTWAASVAAPSAKAQFVKNLNKAGDAAWQAGVKNKGAARYPQGVQTGAAKWASNVAPYFSALKSLSLPPRGLRRSAQNFARVQTVANALAAVKTAGT